MYKITVTYDGNTKPKYVFQYSDELHAHQEFAKYTDWGFANEYSTVNMSVPSGKMYTKVFYRNGKVVTK